MSEHKIGRLIRSGTTADFVLGREGEGIKIFHHQLPYHVHEMKVANIAHQAGIQAPAVIEGLIEIEGQEAIVFEYVEGPSLADHINAGQADVVQCALDMAALHIDIHSHLAPAGLLTSQALVALATPQAEGLTDKTKEAILARVKSLPTDHRICHNDFGPHNIIVSETGMVIVDWAMGTSGPPLSDFAHAELLSTVWMGEVSDEDTPSSWRVFWDTYLDAYRQRCPYSDEELQNWKLAAAATLLFFGVPTYRHYYLHFIKSVLD